MDLEGALSGSCFKRTIKSYCNNVGFNIYEINDRKAVLRFETESGIDQFLYIIIFDSTLEFSVPSGFTYDEDDEDDDEFIGKISTYLMKRNASRKVGFWSIEKIGDEMCYSIMHNAEMSLMDAGYFHMIVTALVSECDDFDVSAKRLSR
jgi:hypothetical protein